MRNRALKNPTFPIHPLAIYRPGHGILEPNLAQFPRNANEFYALRNPETNWHRLMLTYLADFYDVRLRSAGSSSDVDSSSDDDKDEIILDHPDLVVERLEETLGLNEDKIKKCVETAALLASRAPSQPIKRSQIRFPKAGPFMAHDDRDSSHASPMPMTKSRNSTILLAPKQYDSLDEIERPPQSPKLWAIKSRAPFRLFVFSGEDGTNALTMAHRMRDERVRW
ncbi:hypothetical protein CORC01_14451 [Colletotrichum orchidophilum]|uniref:Uncharacterized protein n=1 Tax=Colletotrichum orchidophilum TaxID=1209926 RepID=A0A1G4AMK1_9PEZI|nr:uncharacterized protein CORC01_14451 [Colletotrichum orchidophilum]OHE90252.1 hypothetical protein CORC01_14451 [Colletotrichum orchidophilum]